MASRLVIESKVGIDISEFIGFRARLPHKFGYTSYLILRNLFVIYQDSIVEVASLDKIVFQQMLHFSDKHESTARSYLLLIVTHSVEYGILVVQYGRIEIYHHLYRKLIVGQ